MKIKINMTCVSKEYEIETKMEKEQQLQLNMLFLVFSGEGSWFLLVRVYWWGESTGLGEFSKWREGERFWVVRGISPPSPSRENPDVWLFN